MVVLSENRKFEALFAAFPVRHATGQETEEVPAVVGVCIFCLGSQQFEKRFLTDVRDVSPNQGFKVAADEIPPSFFSRGADPFC